MHKTEIHTEARYFDLKVVANSDNKERKKDEEFVENVIFFKINKRGS